MTEKSTTTELIAQLNARLNASTETIATLTSALEKLRAENKRLREAARFVLAHVFDPPNGWYPDNAFPDDPRSVEEQIEDGRDSGPAYVSKSRELLRAALKEPAP